MGCHSAYAREYLIRLHHYKPPLSIYVSVRVNEQWLSFEPESRAVISLSPNTPTSSNDAKTCLVMLEHEPFEEYEKKKWNKEDLKKDGCSNVYVFRWRQYFTIERWGGGVVGSFRWVGMRVCVDLRVRLCFSVIFFLKGNGLLTCNSESVCLSVNHSLMSCRLWEGSGIIKHFQWVPRREMTGCVKFFIISKNKKPASPLTGNFNQL